MSKLDAKTPEAKAVIARLRRVARALEVAFDVLEERDGEAIDPAYREALRVVEAWKSSRKIDRATEACRVAFYRHVFVPQSDIDRAAFYLLGNAQNVMRLQRSHDHTAQVLYKRAMGVAKKAFGPRGEELMREAWG